MSKVTPDLKARLLAYHAALQPFDEGAVRAAFAPDAEYHSPGIGRPLKGRDEIAQAFAEYFARFPDQRSTDLEIQATEPTKLRTHWVLVARDETTGRPVHRRGTEDAEFDELGQILRITVADLP